MFLQLVISLSWSNTTYGIDLVWMVQKRLKSPSFLVFPSKCVPSAWSPIELLCHAFWTILKLSWILDIFFQSVNSIFFAWKSKCFSSCSVYWFIIVSFQYSTRMSNVIFLKCNIFNSLLMAKIFVLNRAISNKSLLVREIQIFLVIEWLQKCIKLVRSISNLNHTSMSWIKFLWKIFNILTKMRIVCWFQIRWVLVYPSRAHNTWLRSCKVLSLSNKLLRSKFHHINIWKILFLHSLWFLHMPYLSWCLG